MHPFPQNPVPAEPGPPAPLPLRVDLGVVAVSKCRFERAAKAGRGPAGRSGAAPRGAKLQTGSEGGQGTGQSVKRGAPRSEASNRQRRTGGAPAGRSGAASRGARVQASGDGSGRDEARAVARARHLTAWGFKRAARADRDTGWSVGCGTSRSRGANRWRERAGAPCAPSQHLDYIYQRVVSPKTSTTPFPVTQSGRTEPLRRTKATSHPRAAPARVPIPYFPALRAARTPDHRPDRDDSGRQGADPGRDARPGITGVLSRCAGRPTPPSPCVFTQVRERQRFQGQPATTPGRRGNAAPARPGPPRPAPPRSAAPDRPAGPLPAFAARLSPGSVGGRARATAFAPPLPAPSPPVLTFALRGAAPDRPAGAPPLPRRQPEPPPRGARARATTCPRPCLRRRRPLEPPPRETPRSAGVPDSVPSGAVAAIPCGTSAERGPAAGKPAGSKTPGGVQWVLGAVGWESLRATSPHRVSMRARSSWGECPPGRPHPSGAPHACGEASIQARACAQAGLAGSITAKWSTPSRTRSSTGSPAARAASV